MVVPSVSDILTSLQSVFDPVNGRDIVSLNMVEGVQVSVDGVVVFMIVVDAARGAAMEGVRQEAERVVRALDGVKQVTAVLTAEKEPPPQGAGAAPDPHGMNKNPPLKLPIKKIIAVASGKGGVGKSTVANALARSIAENSQLKVGILDGDIYGPSQIILSGLETKKPDTNAARMIIPPVLAVDGNPYGVKVMSIALMVDAGKALVWRGPMVQSAMYQLFRDVQWCEDDTELDVLIVDMPPGTGDAQLTLAQKVPVDGAIIVSTPQDLALADARKGVEMFNATGVRVLGLIENMSTHICTNCGHEEHIFGHGGAKAEAETLGVAFLGEIPLSAEIRARADAGEKVALPASIMEIILAQLHS
ncbi:MAG: Mrp/NBP35 family ATP-binding protein [Micavibrio sp.]|nr:Mrp/NBP35 family ATP-binding protein [Micavibrio sp.]